MIIQIYMMEAVLLRTLKSNGQHQEIKEAISIVFMNEATDKIRIALKEVASKATDKDTVQKTIAATDQLMQLPVVDIIALRRKIASHFIQENQYKI